jgi:hypothetical protein
MRIESVRSLRYLFRNLSRAIFSILWRSICAESVADKIAVQWRKAEMLVENEKTKKAQGLPLRPSLSLEISQPLKLGYF